MTLLQLKSMKLLSNILLLFVFAMNASASENGVASWYGAENRVSATGKRLNHKVPALAHKTLPLGTMVKITNTKTKASVIAVVEDRGPYKKGRIADLNLPAAKKLGMVKSGLAKVTVEKI